MSRNAPGEGKKVLYSNLVHKRINRHMCEHLGLTNPSEYEEGKFDNAEQIGPWTQWQGNRNAELMVVGQDWGGTNNFETQKGVDIPDKTTRPLCVLLKSLGIKKFEALLPGQKQPEGLSLFFTNSVLCLRSGTGATGGTVSPCWFKNCSVEFLRPQVELVIPKVVVALGLQAFRSLVTGFKGSSRGELEGGARGGSSRGELEGGARRWRSDRGDQTADEAEDAGSGGGGSPTNVSDT